MLGKRLTLVHRIAFSSNQIANIFATINHNTDNPKATMNISLAIAPIVSLIAGILILIVPRMLNYIVAIYLIVIGILGLFPHLR